VNIRPTCRIPVKLESRFGDFLKNATLGKYEVRVVREQTQYISAMSFKNLLLRKWHPFCLMEIMLCGDAVAGVELMLLDETIVKLSPTFSLTSIIFSLDVRVERTGLDLIHIVEVT
jgi:hypothetical protein